MMKTLTARLWLPFLLLAATLPAQRLPLPPLAQKGLKIEAGTRFRSDRWQSDAELAWVSPGKNAGLALALGRGEKLETVFELPVAKADESKAGSKEHALIVEFQRSPGQAAPVEIELKLVPPDRSSGPSTRHRLARGEDRGLLILRWPAEDDRPGSSRVELRNIGRATAFVMGVDGFHLPIDPEAVSYAKPNGVDGPDRFEAGALGFEGMSIDDCHLLPVKMVRPESPAAKAGLQPGDWVIGLEGEPLRKNSCKAGFRWFEQGHEAQFGRALESALSASRPEIELEVMRRGKRQTLRLKPAARAPLPESFPFDDELSPRLKADLLDFVRRTRKPGGFWQNGGNEWIQTCFAGLALLGERDPRDAETIREIADWYLGRFPDAESFGNLGFWAASYSGIFMCEYLLASGDDRVRPFIERGLRFIEAGFHTSKWGSPSLGHGPSGLPYDQKALMAPASHAIVFEALARKAGFQSRIWETLLPYMISAWSDPAEKGHGAMGYNASYRDQDEFWSRSGLFALAAELRGEKKHMREALVKVMRARHPYMRNSHAYGNPGDAWGLLGLAAVDREAFAEVMRAWRWSIGGAWEMGYGLRHSTAHMGSPYMGEEGLVNPAYAAVLAARKSNLFMLGAADQDRGWLVLPERSAPQTTVDIGWSAAGLVVLEAQHPGVEIRYSLDGQLPDRRATLYEGPFALADGGLVRARAFDGETAVSKVASRALGLPAAPWRILEAEGARDPEEARRRARHLIDGDPRIPWQPDRGQDAAEPPLTVLIDLGAPQLFDGLRFSGPYKLRSLKLALGLERTGLEAKLESRELPEKTDALRFSELVEARYLLIEFVAMQKGEPFRIGEMELLWPEIRASHEEGQVTLSTSRPELVLRAARDEAPSAKSAEVRGPMKWRKGSTLRARLFDRSGRAVGPVVFVSEPGEDEG